MNSILNYLKSTANDAASSVNANSDSKVSNYESDGDVKTSTAKIPDENNNDFYSSSYDNDALGPDAQAPFSTMNA